MLLEAVEVYAAVVTLKKKKTKNAESLNQAAENRSVSNIFSVAVLFLHTVAANRPSVAEPPPPTLSHVSGRWNWPPSAGGAMWGRVIWASTKWRFQRYKVALLPRQSGLGWGCRISIIERLSTPARHSTSMFCSRKGIVTIQYCPVVGKLPGIYLFFDWRVFLYMLG